MQMSLSNYLSGSNFHKYDATLANGGLITAHHNRDTSTEKYYAAMKEGEYLISYKLPDGYVSCVAVDGAEQVSCTLTK